MAALTLLATAHILSGLVGNTSSPWDYDNPFVGGGCRPNEIVAQTSIPGAWCAPACSPTLACSTNTAPYAPWVPKSSYANVSCMLQFEGNTYPTACGIQCCPACWGSCSARGMQCQPFGGSGVCVWPEPSAARAAAAEAGVRELGQLPVGTVAAARAPTRDQLPLAITVCVRAAPGAPCAAPKGITLAALPWSARAVQAAATVEAGAASPPPHGTSAATLTLTLDKNSGALSIEALWPYSTPGGLTLVLQAPRDILAATLAATKSVSPTLAVRIAGCSNGRDDDGNAAADFPLDTACTASWDEEGAAAPAVAAAAAAGTPALAWTVQAHKNTGAGMDGAFVSSLTFLPQGAGGASVPIWTDEVAAGVSGAVRYFLHDASSPSTSLTYLNLTSNALVMLEQLTATKVLLSSTPTSAVIQYTWPGTRFTVTDTYTLAGDTLSAQVSVASGYTGAGDIFLVDLPVNFGGLALGRRGGDGTLDLSNSGLWRFDSKRVGSLYLGTANCGWNETDRATDAYPNFGGYFSAVAGLGDDRVSLGWSTLDTLHSPDTQHNFSVNYYAYMKATRSPLMQQFHSQVLYPGDVHNFTVVLKAGVPAAVGVLDCSGGGGMPPPTPLPPASRDVATLMQVFTPYYDFFHALHGNTPTYCPTPNAAWQNAVDQSFNASTAYYKPNTTIKSLLNYDAAVIHLPPTKMSLYGVWSGGLRSEHMTLDNSNYEFNPVIEAFDPNTDILADPSRLTTAISDFKTNAGIDQFFWFHRPCDVSG